MKQYVLINREVLEDFIKNNSERIELSNRINKLFQDYKKNPHQEYYNFYV